MADLTEVTVNLSSRSVDAMERLAKASGDTKTDVINKALQVYDHIYFDDRLGGELYVRDPGSNVFERLRFT